MGSLLTHLLCMVYVKIISTQSGIFAMLQNKEIYKFLDDVCVEDEMVSLLKFRLRFIIEIF